MKKVIRLTENDLRKMVQDAVKEQKSINEFYDDMDDNHGDDDYNELDSLFNTEHDYDGETLRGDEEGFSNKLRQKHIHKNIKADHLGMGAVHPSYSKKKDIEIPRDKEGREVKWTPLKSDDLPLDKYLEKKKMNNLDEDEDIAMLDNLLKKD